MPGRIDVRRTEGGLRLLVPVTDSWSRRSVRLSYPQADTLISAIRGGEVRSCDGKITLTPEAAGASWAVLAEACSGTFVADEDIHELEVSLCAHMPDRMTPLGDPAEAGRRFAGR